MPIQNPISFPFSPRFLLLFNKHVDETSILRPVEENRWRFEPEFAFSNYEIDTLINAAPEDIQDEIEAKKREDVQKDAYRTAWHFRKKEQKEDSIIAVSGTLALGAQKSIEQLIDRSKELNLPLSKEDAQALMVMSIATQHEKITQGGILQLGHISFQTYMQHFQMNASQDFTQLTGLALKQKLLERGATNAINISAISELNEDSSEALRYEKEAGLITINYHFQVKEKNLSKTEEENKGYQVSTDLDRYEVKIDQRIWNDILIKGAYELLNKKEPLSKDDIYLLVPMLADPRITKEFAKKLAATKEKSPELIKETNHLIGVCFEHRHKDLSRIARELQRQHVDDHLRPLALIQEECDGYQKHLEKIIESEFRNIYKKFTTDPDYQEINVWEASPQKTPDAMSKILNEKPLKINDMIELMNNKAIPPDQSKERFKVAAKKYVALQDILKESSAIDLASNEERLKKFAEKFTEKEKTGVFADTADPRTEHFIKVIKIVLSAIPGLNLITVPSMILHSGSLKFWQTRDQIFKEKVNEKKATKETNEAEGNQAAPANSSSKPK